MSDSYVVPPTKADIGRYPELKMAATKPEKPEVETSLERKKLAKGFQRPSPIFDHARLENLTADTARHLELKNGGQ